MDKYGLETLLKQRSIYSLSASSFLGTVTSYSAKTSQLKEHFATYYTTEFPSEPLLLSCHCRFLAFPVHSHEFFEMMYVYSGEVTHRFGERAITLNAGDILIVAPEVCHSVDMGGEDDLAVNFLMTKEFVSRSLFKNIYIYQKLIAFFTEALSNGGHTGSQYLIFKTGNNEKVHSIASEIMCEFFDPDSFSETALECMLPLFFSAAVRSSANDNDTFDRARYSNGRSISPILRYIETNCKTATLKSVAAHFGYSPASISALLKRNYGESFMKLRHRFCMNLAGALLTDPDILVSEVAESVGFSNISFFYDLFGRYYGTTPAEYKKRMNLKN